MRRETGSSGNAFSMEARLPPNEDKTSITSLQADVQKKIFIHCIQNRFLRKI